MVTLRARLRENASVRAGHLEARLFDATLATSKPFADQTRSRDCSSLRLMIVRLEALLPTSWLSSPPRTDKQGGRDCTGCKRDSAATKLRPLCICQTAPPNLHANASCLPTSQLTKHHSPPQQQSRLARVALPTPNPPSATFLKHHSAVIKTLFHSQAMPGQTARP